MWDFVGPGALFGMERRGKAAFSGTNVFQGTTLHTLDAKGRLAVPARHREAFAADAAAEDGSAGLVLTRHPDGCLVLYPLSVWEER